MDGFRGPLRARFEMVLVCGVGRSLASPLTVGISRNCLLHGLSRRNPYVARRRAESDDLPGGP
jgi:hypothetical protein